MDALMKENQCRYELDYIPVLVACQWFVLLQQYASRLKQDNARNAHALARAQSDAHAVRGSKAHNQCDSNW